MARRIVVIGCGAAGGTAAQFARKTDREAEITIVEKTGYAQYSKCGLPYAIAGLIRFDDLVEFSKEWFERNRINLMLETEVCKIDTVKKLLEISGAEGKQKIGYDSLIIATGARPAVPHIEGMEKDGIYFLRTMDDGKKLSEVIAPGKKILIIGAGLVGMEIAEALMNLNIDVTVVEYMKSPLPGMVDPDMAEVLQEQMNGRIKIILNSTVTKVLGNKKVEGAVVKNNETGAEEQIPADILVIATGNHPVAELAAGAGCEIGASGGIKINNRCETSISGIYAVGDCTEYPDFITGQPVAVGLGSIGVRQAMVAGTNAAGGNSTMKNILATRTTHLFGLEIAAAGPIQATLEKSGIKPFIGKFRGKSLPHYFPGGKPVNVKVMCNNSGRILSAQIAGEGAALRINTFATAILKEMTVDEFSMIETAYAPPVAPALDPIVLGAEACRMRLRHEHGSA